jgi:hypothetical protein
VTDTVFVSIGSAYRASLDRVVRAGAVHSSAKSENGVSFGAEQDVLLIDRPFQWSLLAGALVVSADDAALLVDVHELGTLPAIRPSGMNCPVASDVCGRLLRHRDGGRSEEQESKTE